MFPAKLLNTLLSLAVLLSGTASAQIQLPPSGTKPRGNLAPHHSCTVCGTRNYTVPSTARIGEDGNAIARCATCQKDTGHANDSAGVGLAPPAQGATGTGERGGLRIPPRGEVPVRNAKGAPAPPKAEAAPAPAPIAPAPVATPLADGPAGFVFAELERLEKLDDPLIAKALGSLAVLGEPARERARGELASERPARLFVAVRLLLDGAVPSDVERVFARSRQKLPSSICAPLTELLMTADPVRASPAFFAEQLAHPSGAMRLASERLLRRDLGPALVPALETALDSKRPEARQLALGLLADIDDPSVIEPLFVHLSDTRSSVAQVALRGLAARPSAEIDARLLERAFEHRWILRGEAYALIALVQREERTLEPRLDERHVDALLSGLGSSDVFVAGSCAVSLAGIGFRSARPSSTPWLDRDVVDRLIHVVSGRVFHDDLGALLSSATTRLHRITGQEFGQDGPRWLEWWAGARAAHVARRAWIEIAPGDEAALGVRWKSGAETLQLLGPAANAGAAGATTVVYLTEAEALALLGVFQKEGLLSPERLPGLRGRRGPAERSLEVVVASRGKTFALGEGANEPWFERAAAAVAEAVERNRWQRFAPLDRSQHAFWLEQSPWWERGPTAEERTLRMKAIVLAFLSGRRLRERDAGLRELARIDSDPASRNATDFDALLSLLHDEAVYGERVRLLVRLALHAGRAAAPAGPLDTQRARPILALLADRYGADARVEITATIRAAGAAFARGLAADPRPIVRAALPRVLIESGKEEDTKVLLALVEDRDPEVEIAAIEALGESTVEAARTELIVRARLGVPRVRGVALFAIGRLGGEYVLDALLLGAKDVDGVVRAGAARGLAELGDAAVAPLLLGMLSEGSDSVVFGPAREGLLRLGEKAWPELQHALVRSDHPARREVALLLAEQGRAEPVTALMQLLATRPGDARVAGELAVLTCVDFRDRADPASAWWEWYDGVVHNDAHAWFRAALERVGEKTPATEAILAPGTRAGRLFLVEVLARPEQELVERARRELARLLGRGLAPLPERGAARDAWIAELRESILSARDP